MKKLLENWNKYLSSIQEEIEKGEWILLDKGDERREQIKQDFYDMVDSTYAPIGGHVKIKSPNDLERYKYWVVIDADADPEVDVGLFAKPKKGTKMVGVGHDGTRNAKSLYKDMSAKLRSGDNINGVGNWWGEVSGGIAYALLKRGGTPLEDEEKAKKLLGDIEWHGEHPDPDAPDLFKAAKGWYTKTFDDGSRHTKIIVGNPL